MKKLVTIASIAIVSLGFSACTNNSKETSNKDTELNASKEIEHTKDLTTPQNELKLNNGEKWEVNQEMVPFVEKAERIFKNYDASQGDLQTLAEQLRINNDQLISSCTMKGEAHEQLHHWLHPHLELVNALGNTSTDREKKAIMASLQNSFQVYHKYFK